MPVCPKCGTEVTNPAKTWSIVDRPTRKGEQFRLRLGMFRCTHCKRKFRYFLRKGKEKITLNVIVKEIREITKRLLQTLGDLREKIKKLIVERAELLEIFERLKKAGEEKAKKTGERGSIASRRN